MLKRTYISLTFLFLLGAPKANCQNKSEFEKHLVSIDSTFFPGQKLDDNSDSVFNMNRAFVDYTIVNLLQNLNDKYFISNRNLLPKVGLVSCDSTSLEFRDTLVTGESCYIKISTSKFVPANNKIVEDKEQNQIILINNQFPYGGQYSIPTREISVFEISVNGKSLMIPQNAYSNLFEPNVCFGYSFYKGIEVYTSLDGKYIYVYIFGGNAAGIYFSKLIFDKEKYLTRIISDYYDLSIHRSFRPDFIGF